MSKEEVRNEVLNSFNDENGYFYHQYPHGYSNFIDGMAWIGLLCGACLKVGDTELAEKCTRYLNILINVGKDARNFAPFPVKDNWKKSKNIEGLWYKEKPQSAAGPLGLMFAVKNGANIDVPDYLKRKYEIKVNMHRFGFFFGYLVRCIPKLKQHINTMFLSYLLAEKKPSSSMKFLIEENPLFSYIYGRFCNVEYPDNTKLNNVKSTQEDDVVPLKYAEPSSWIFRRDPFKKVVDAEKGILKYTRVAELVGDYLQSTLEG